MPAIRAEPFEHRDAGGGSAFEHEIAPERHHLTGGDAVARDVHRGGSLDRGGGGVRLQRARAGAAAAGENDRSDRQSAVHRGREYPGE